MTESQEDIWHKNRWQSALTVSPISLRSRFISHLTTLAIDIYTEDSERLWNDIAQRYTEPQRYYHSLEHLDYLFAHFDCVAHDLKQPSIVALALFYHDVIYEPKPQPKQDSNELRSAEHAARQLAGYLAADQIKQISSLILMTESHQLDEVDNRARDAAYLLDLDLSILGASWSKYNAYAKAVRQEYHHVTDALYQSGRTAVLAGLLAKPRLYLTPYFYERLEQQARGNINQELAALHAE
ncbi:hypothetical protein [Psychrobacter pygoscelis]|uniref:HD domain-containing protein n=1 Tax=Psychrobacter pygoscelis TaxID=2488563 RepID=UPI00103DECB4|nr:hypothetical protein [Psychrobacter pygoscelis]